MLSSQSFTIASLLVACTACGGTAQAKRPAPDHQGTAGPIAERAPTPVSAYSLELVDGQGHTLDTYQKNGRFYVHGSKGQRYGIRVQNRSGSRIEAVISVDGLDVIDGEAADFRAKRGYLVGAHSEVTIEGFRVSTREVATFRFSSVSNSYAGRKGKARNVGVIGVAVFTEREHKPIVIPHPRPHHPRHRRHRYDQHVPDRLNDDAPAREESSESDQAGPQRSRSTLAPQSAHTGRSTLRHKRDRSRPGLGTEFGEERSSEVQFTHFTRASQAPSTILQMRYNNARGLQALGIDVRRPHHRDEDVALRESANPFPAMRFAKPPY